MVREIKNSFTNNQCEVNVQSVSARVTNSNTTSIPIIKNFYTKNILTMSQQELLTMSEMKARNQVIFF